MPLAAVLFNVWHGNGKDDVNTPHNAGALTTDLDLMHSIAAATDTRNEEIRAMLQTFIGRVSSVPPTVWGGLAATRFKEVVERWNSESRKLHNALHNIAEAIRANETALREAGENHARHIGSAGGNL